MTDRPRTADDFLRSVREARIEKRRCEFRLEELRAQCEKVTASYGPLAPGGSGDGHKDGLLVTVAQETDELLRLTQVYIRRIHDVEQFISTLDDVKHRTVLRLRYVDGLRWDAVSAGMKEYGLYYSERGMYKLHGEALAEARVRFDTWAEVNDVWEEDEPNETA